MLCTPASAAYIGMPISVHHCFYALLGTEAILEKIKKKCGTVLGSLATLLQTIVFKGSIGRELMLAVFKRRRAIICDRGEFATDIVIPMVFPGRKEKDTRTLKTSDISGICVHVKNRPRSRMSKSEVDSL